MNNNGQKNSPGRGRKSTPTNPFARALAEAEKSSYNNQKPHGKNPFSEALARTGGSFPDDGTFPDNFSDLDLNSKWEEEQKKRLEKEQKREALRKKLHDKVNPIDNKELFDAREKQVKKEIEELRKELKLLAKEVSKFNKDIEITLMSETVNPGQDGKYYITFFQKLRAFIILLRKKIHSARTWATQMHSKKKKKKRGGGPMSFEGKGGHEKTKTVYDMMHHEVSNARSGG